MGRDVRLSSEAIEEAFIAGLRSMGVHVTTVGEVPIPVCNFAIAKGGFDYGAYVTASHNPAQYDGLRFRRKDGSGFTEENDEIRDMFFSGKVGSVSWEDMGTLKRIDPRKAMKDYGEFLKERYPAIKSQTIVIDPGNGSAALNVPALLEEMGHKVHVVNGEIDGRFSGRGSEPKDEKLGAAKDMVKAVGADFGVAFDGDADRAVFIDDKGRAVQVEKSGIIIAREMLRAHPGGKILVGIPCSMRMEPEIEKAGGKVVRVRVGDVYVCQEIRKHNAIFAMEISAHFFVPDHYIFDDPTQVTLIMSRLLARGGGKRLSQLVDEIPSYPTIEKGYTVADDVKFQVIDGLTKDFKKRGEELDLIDGVKVCRKDGWALLRCSNTQPMIRLFIESKDKPTFDRYFREFEGDLKRKVSEMQGKAKGRSKGKGR